MSGIPAGQGFKGFEAYTGGNKYFALTAAMGTTAKLIKSGPGRLCSIVNGQAAAQTQVVTLYDAAFDDATTLSSAQVIWTGIVPASTTPKIDIQIPVTNGIVIQAAAALTGSILVTFV
jgi:hypothetical protein